MKDYRNSENFKKCVKENIDRIEKGVYTFFDIEDLALLNSVIDELKKSYDPNKTSDHVKKCFIIYYLSLIRRLKYDIFKFDEIFRLDMINYINDISGKNFSLDDNEDFTDYVIYEIKYDPGRDEPFYV